MPKVNYNGKTVSDENIKTILERIAKELDGDIEIKSGDRDSVPGGGSATSHHLQKRAADFSVPKLTFAVAFSTLKTKEAQIFDADKKYQVIHHGVHTATGGEHLHVGRYDTGKGVSYLVEGLTAESKGSYTAG